MRKLSASLALTVVGVLSVAAPARASVITFEDLYVGPNVWDPTLFGLGMRPVPPEYTGFQWSPQAAVINKDSGAITTDTAYHWGTIETMSLFNAYGADISFAGGTFDFNGAYISAHADAPYDLVVQGFRNGALVTSKAVTIMPWPSPETGLPYFYTFNFREVDSLAFVTGGRWVVIDNITINEPFDAAALLSRLARTVDGLVASGTVKRGIGHSLGQKLAAADSALASGERQTALDKLDAFIREIETHIRACGRPGGHSEGSFPPAEGKALIEAARNIAAAI